MTCLLNTIISSQVNSKNSGDSGGATACSAHATDERAADYAASKLRTPSLVRHNHQLGCDVEEHAPELAVLVSIGLPQLGEVERDDCRRDDALRTGNEAIRLERL